MGESQGGVEDIEVASPFLKRMQFIINELNQLKINSNIDEGEKDKEGSFIS